MNERKDDIIIGLLVVIIILQVYSLFLGNNSMPQNDTAGWQDYAGQDVTTLPADTDVNIKEALGNTVKEADANNDPSSGANVPGVPGQQPSATASH